MNRKIESFDVAHLFPEMRTELLGILQGLDDTDWKKPTACEGWSVKDVALHMLSDDIGIISRQRDNDGITFMTDDFAELVSLINRQNDMWLRATQRMSKKLLLSLLEFTGAQLHKYWFTVDISQGEHRVDWAGTQAVPMGLELARELTEYWMHHQHICEGLGINSLKNRRFLHPVLSAFVHALPRTYANISADDATVIELRVTGEAADSWFLRRENDAWSLYAEVDDNATTIVTMSDDTAWRLFTKGISPTQALERVSIIGDYELGKILLNTVAILA